MSWRENRIKAAIEGNNPMVIKELAGGYAVFGDAILASTYAIRINYDILGNTDAYLHAHIFPRYDWEVEERRKMPVWLYDKSNWSNEETAYAEEKHGELRQKIASY